MSPRTTLTVLTLAVAFIVAVLGVIVIRPWPLVVLHGDLYSWLDGQVAFFGLIAFLFNMVLLLGTHYLARWLSTRHSFAKYGWRGRLTGYGLALSLAVALGACCR